MGFAHHELLYFFKGNKASVDELTRILFPCQLYLS